jgi:hypothetical protein
MDPHYLRLRRRRRLWRAAVVCVFFGLLSLPVLYLLRGEIRAVAAKVYRYAKQEFQAARAADQPPPPPSSTPSPTPAPAPAPPPEAAVVQATPAPPPAPAVRYRTAKLGDRAFRIPEGYLEGDGDLGSKKNPEILLRALLPDLRPRASGQGDCAPKRSACADFVIVKLRTGRSTVEAEFIKRYKVAPATVRLIPGIHGLQQIPPPNIQPSGTRQFLAQPAGRWVWITCRDVQRPKPNQAAPGICQLAFDTADGLGMTVRFGKDKLGDWSAIQVKAMELAASVGN